MPWSWPVGWAQESQSMLETSMCCPFIALNAGLDVREVAPYPAVRRTACKPALAGVRCAARPGVCLPVHRGI